MRDKDFHENDDWDEDDWERFLQKTDVRNAKYMELFETLHNHPHCDVLIAEEMGWSHKYEDCDDKNESCDDCDRSNGCYTHEIGQIFDKYIEYDEATERDIENVKKITAYKRSYKFCIRLREYFNNNKGIETDENVRDAVASSSIVPAKIAGGHGMGYEKDSLCGNIANCKRSLKNARKCIYSLELVRANALFPESEMNILISEAIKVEREVIKWIEELRSKIWWR